MDTTFDSQIEQIVQSIFASMLGMDVARSVDEPASCCEKLISTIHITGAQSLTVVLGASSGAAAAAASAMLQLRPEETTDDDQRDVVAELTNMIGGNLKSLLPSPCFLSLPTVLAGRELGLEIPGAELVEDVLLQCESGTLRVRLFAPLANS
jgi:chemotaxis protein CheX